jgi:hypothetical protein
VQSTYRRQGRDACMLDCNDKWRGSGVLVSQIQARVIRRNKEPDNESASNVEQQDTDVYTFDSLGEITSRILCFTSGDLTIEVTLNTAIVVCVQSRRTATISVPIYNGNLGLEQGQTSDHSRRRTLPASLLPTIQGTGLWNLRCLGIAQRGRDSSSNGNQFDRGWDHPQGPAQFQE